MIKKQVYTYEFKDEYFLLEFVSDPINVDLALSL